MVKVVSGRGALRSRRVVFDDASHWGELRIYDHGFDLACGRSHRGPSRCSPFFTPMDFPRGTYLYWRDQIMAQFVRRLSVETEGGIMHERAVDEAFAQDYPAISEFLTLDWLEGATRQTSTLGVSVDAGQWKVRLADRENGLVCFVSGDGFYAALDALEKALGAGTGDWRSDQFAKPKKSPRRS